MQHNKLKLRKLWWSYLTNKTFGIAVGSLLLRRIVNVAVLRLEALMLSTPFDLQPNKSFEFTFLNIPSQNKKSINKYWAVVMSRNHDKLEFNVRLLRTPHVQSICYAIEETYFSHAVNKLLFNYIWSISKAWMF